MREETGDKASALAAYRLSVQAFETKAARRKAERLAAEFDLCELESVEGVPPSAQAQVTVVAEGPARTLDQAASSPVSSGPGHDNVFASMEHRQPVGVSDVLDGQHRAETRRTDNPLVRASSSDPGGEMPPPSDVWHVGSPTFVPPPATLGEPVVGNSGLPSWPSSLALPAQSELPANTAATASVHDVTASLAGPKVRKTKKRKKTKTAVSQETASFGVRVEGPKVVDLSPSLPIPLSDFDMPPVLDVSLEASVGPSVDPPLEGSIEAVPRASLGGDRSALEALLVTGDGAACAGAAARVLNEAPNDFLALRLAARAVLQEAEASSPGAALSPAAALIVAHAARFSDRAAQLILELQQSVPRSWLEPLGPLWIAAAHAAGRDVDRVWDLLIDVAVLDAPHGPPFRKLDQMLAAAGDTTRRDQLLQRSLRAGQGSTVPELLRARIELLEVGGRPEQALPVHAQLCLEHDVPPAVRAGARRAHLRGSAEERARFLARLARKAPAAEALDILRELLGVRVHTGDQLGAEAAARDLLKLAPGDPGATEALARLLADDDRRTPELVQLLRARAEAARKVGDFPATMAALEKLATTLLRDGHDVECAGVWMEIARLAPNDVALVDRVVLALESQGRIADTVALLEELAPRQGGRHGGRLLLRAASLARTRLRKRGRARELIDRAAQLAPHDVEVLRAQADSFIELGDIEGAVVVLERLVVELPQPTHRGQVMGELAGLLEALGRPAEAMRRWRAVVEADGTSLDGWQRLLRLAREGSDGTLEQEALAGLVAALPEGQRAARFGELAILHEAAGDSQAARRAWAQAIDDDPTSTAALRGFLSITARLTGSDNIEQAAQSLSSTFLDAVRSVLLRAEEAGAPLSFSEKRMLALSLTQAGARGAIGRFEELLEKEPTDQLTLLAFARFLGSTAARGAPDGDRRRREVLETLLECHGGSLPARVLVEAWGEVCALRLEAREIDRAMDAARTSLSLLPAGDAAAAGRGSLAGALSDRAVRALGACLASDSDVDQGLLLRALDLDFERALAPREKARNMAHQARIQAERLQDPTTARRLLNHALEIDADASEARQALFDLDLHGEDPRRALEQSRALLVEERDPKKKAQLHLRLFRLQQKLQLSDEAAAAELRAAVDLDPRHVDILDAAARYFQQRRDALGLDRLYSAQLKSLDRDDVAGRLALLDRLSLLRRYELRDPRGAIDALEAMAALEPEAHKPREDAARIYLELSQWKQAQGAFRAVLDRDLLAADAWRGLFSACASAREPDESFCVAATMVSLEIADDDLVRAVKAVRPPFPRWPTAPADPLGFRRRLAHPAERAAVRAVLEIVAPRLLPRLGRSLAELGLSAPVAQQSIAPSFLVAVRVGLALLGLRELPIFRADDVDAAAFSAPASSEPALVVSTDVLRGGITPERAFALGRAVAMCAPWSRLAALLGAVELRRLLEGLVFAFLSARDVQQPSAQTEAFGATLAAELRRGAAGEVDALRTALIPALRDWVHVRGQIQLDDWLGALHLSADRLGFLLCGELQPALRAVRAVRAASGRTGVVAELVRFSVAHSYLQLRRELGLSLPASTVGPLLELP